MTARRVAVVAGLVGGAGWIVKMLVMAAQGGPDLDSVPETVAFLTGLVGVPVAAAAAAAHLTRDHSVLVRTVSAAAAFVGVLVLVGLAQSALSSLPGDHWTQEEAPLGLAGLVALVGGLALARSRERSGATA